MLSSSLIYITLLDDTNHSQCVSVAVVFENQQQVSTSSQPSIGDQGISVLPPPQVKRVLGQQKTTPPTPVSPAVFSPFPAPTLSSLSVESPWTSSSASAVSAASARSDSKTPRRPERWPWAAHGHGQPFSSVFAGLHSCRSAVFQ